ncbi:MAG TPA: hypothetical protein DF699_10040, partial [Phycisphaerales bacterium]|nr:hypothetical protein [Phycisphaerales bacterium]
YGPNIVRKASSRLALHAHRLVFQHPVTGEKVDIETKFPRDLKNTLNRLNLPSPDAIDPGQLNPPSTPQ